MLKTLEMDLEFLPYLDAPPMSTKQLQDRAVSNDEVTVQAWRDIWINNAKANYEKYGPFVESHVGQFFGILKQKPCIVLGSGPSLANSVEALKKNKDIYVISCLHNFHYLIDHDIKVDLWVSLDSGPVTIEEISEGGKHDHEYYLEATKGQKLATFISTDPGLVESWKGGVYWYSCGIPDEGVRKALQDVEKFEVYLSTGGNVLGAATYIAKAIMGANPIALAGADFCFSYTKTFHPWKSKYDGNLGKPMITNDIFGNKVYTWRSYNNFKSWFEGVAMRCPGDWVNISEGGTLGAYPQGLNPAIKQETTWDFIYKYQIHEEMRHMCENPHNATEDGYSAPKILF